MTPLTGARLVAVSIISKTYKLGLVYVKQPSSALTINQLLLTPTSVLKVASELSISSSNVKVPEVSYSTASA